MGKLRLQRLYVRSRGFRPVNVIQILPVAPRSHDSKVLNRNWAAGLRHRVLHMWSVTHEYLQWITWNKAPEMIGWCRQFLRQSAALHRWKFRHLS